MLDSATMFLADRTGERRRAVWPQIAGTAVLALSPFLFVLALRPFAYGIWFQAEPVTVGLLAIGAAAGLCILALDRAGHPVADVLARPTVRIMAGFVGWNAIVSVLQEFPARTWFGAPEIGEGVFAFLALLLLTVLAMVLWPLRLPRRVLAAAAALSAVTIGGLDAGLPLTSPWRPEMFASYAGSIGPAVALIVAGAIAGPMWRRLALAALAGLPVVVFSQNKTAIVLCCLVGPLALWGVWRARRVGEARLRRMLAWGPVAAIVVFGIVLAVPLAFDWYDPLYSLRSRSLLAVAAVRGLLLHPGGLLWGFGWGAYNDVLYRHTFVWGVRAYRTGVWNPDWEGISAGTFHSHYEVLETVLGAGLVGGVLYLMWFRSLVRHARADLLGLAGVVWLLQTGGASLWFPFMLSFPFLALAFAATLVVPDAGAPFPVRRLGRTWQAGAAVAAGLLGSGALMMAQDAVAGGRLLQALNRQDSTEAAAFRGLPSDHGRGGAHLWWAALNDAAFISGRLAEGQKPTYGQGFWYMRLLDEIDAWTASGRAGMRLMAVGLALRNELVAGHENTVLASLRSRELPHWPEAVLRVIHAAPERTDVAVPYLAWLAASKQVLPILALCSQVFELHPQDRVCRWYGGFALLSDPSTEAAGLASMHQALAQEVEAVAPVTSEARLAVETEAQAQTQSQGQSQARGQAEAPGQAGAR